MTGSRLGEAVSLLRQGVEIELRFGTHSLAAMAELAETVEASVYVPRSLVARPGGLAFSLANPPLRVGAFREVRVRVDGVPVPSPAVRIRWPGARDGTRASEVTAGAPLRLRAGDPTDWEVDGVERRVGDPVVVRVELVSLAIPPLVWLELHERVGTDPGP